MKIRTAIFGTYVIASAAGLMVLMWFVLAEVRPRYVSSIERTMQDAANVIAATLAARPAATWREGLEEMEPGSAGLYLRIEDTTGAVLFQSMRAEAALAAGLKSSKLREGLSRAMDREAYQPTGDLTVAALVEIDGQVQGRVILARPLRTVNEFVWGERRKLALGAALIALVMVGLGWWLAQKLTRSLERLATYAARVRDGRDAQPPASRAMEIAQVGDAFEGMRRALEGKDYAEHFTQHLAHELKAPLAAIRANAELLQEEPAPADRQRFLRNLQSESERVQAVVERILRLAALESQQRLEKREAVDLVELTHEATESFADRATAAGVVLAMADNSAADAAVSGERFLLSQALRNLIENAIEHAPAKGRVVVRVDVVAETGDRRVTVEDDGPGLPDYARERVFERFYSLPRPGTGRKGTGLGLSFVREIAGLHGGTAGVENRQPTGLRAWLRLPGISRTDR